MSILTVCIFNYIAWHTFKKSGFKPSAIVSVMATKNTDRQTQIETVR